MMKMKPPKTVKESERNEAMAEVPAEKSVGLFKINDV